MTLNLCNDFGINSAVCAMCRWEAVAKRNKVELFF